MNSLYDQIGIAMITQVITRFYQRAFDDAIIGHFFFGKDHQALVQKQILFAAAMLGSTEHRYDGRPVKPLHHELPIKPPHFGRRQVLLEEVLVEVGLAPALRAAWLAEEEKLKPLIVRTLGRKAHAD